MPKATHSLSKARETVEPSALPSRCRTRDARNRAWSPKVRYAEAAAAKEAVGKNKQQVAYRCGDHWHIGAKK